MTPDVLKVIEGRYKAYIMILEEHLTRALTWQDRLSRRDWSGGVQHASEVNQREEAVKIREERLAARTAIMLSEPSVGLMLRALITSMVSIFFLLLNFDANFV